MRSLSAPGLLLLASALAAQSPASIERAVGAITPQDIRRRIGILADDSMRGRDTPSPELEQVATYIAAEFGRFGLRPGGDNGGYVQRYRILRRQVDTSQRSEEHTSELQSRFDLVCRLLLEKKK